MRGATHWALALVVVMSFSASARADDASESRTRRELGQEYYRQGRYQEALDMFLEAYRLVPIPTLAFDVAQTYGLLDRPVQSFNWYQTFLQASEGDARLSAGRAQAEAALATLRSRVAVLELSSDPPGAEVFVDRVELGSWGVTPRALAVPAGPHTLTLRARDHHDQVATVTGTLGQTTPVQVTLDAILGTVVITSEPPGAAIENARTGAVLGTTPLTISVPIGELRIRSRLAGWVDTERTLDIEEGREARLTMTLAREASTVAVLSVEGEPAGARVLVDAREVGVVPVTLDTLAVGTHRVSVTSDSREPITRDLVLEAGGATRLAVVLRPVASWDWPTWRWLAYGVGAAALLGGATTGTLALLDRDQFFADPTRSQLDTQRERVGATDALFAGGAIVLAVTLTLDLTLQPPSRSEAEVTLDR